MVSIVQYLFYAVRIVWQEKMPPTRRRTAECYWLVEVRFCHDMGAIYRVGVFILQFPAAGKSIAGFSDGNFPAGIIVQDSLSPRIVLAAAAADVHFKPVGEFRSLAQRRTIALHFRAAKVLLDALSVRFASSVSVSIFRQHIWILLSVLGFYISKYTHFARIDNKKRAPHFCKAQMERIVCQHNSF